ncbi:MAG: flotillin [Lentisphaerae bacterium GWF2_49_21]|nr:MAG: flotillin [Lentisphaerae bacterium GWF2_49_21]
MGSGIGSLIGLMLFAAFFAFVLLLIWASRYKKCPSDRIMVIYGKTKGKEASMCIHGGAKFIWPVVQDYGFLSLRPLQIEVNLGNALCKQNIRINVPSVFTVGISTDLAIMGNAAQRLFGLTPDAIIELSRDIIFGQLRLVIASMTIEEINADREKFLNKVEDNVAQELNKVGLELLNVNITDITDESGYIEAIGKKAASEAINRAKIDVAEQVKLGSIGEADASKIQRISVSKADADAQSGEANAARDRRIAVKQAESEAVNGENISSIEIAKSNAVRSEQEAEAFRKAESAKRVAEAQIEKAHFEAEQQAQMSRANMEREKQRAEIIVPAEIAKQQIEIGAEAQAEKLRREAKGQADATFAKLQAEGRGNYEILKAKAAGFQEIVKSCNSDSDAAAKMLLIEKLETIVSLQTEAIKNIKIDKVTVWEGGQGAGGKTSTANFLSGMMQSLPPLHDVANMAGIDLPGYLGKVKYDNESQVQEPKKK